MTAQVRDLAWTDQHAKAIELASQGLLTSKIKINEQMDLLDLRAESYIAQANLDLAAKDADAMVKLAKPVGAGLSRLALTAQALNRKAIIQMHRGEIKPAIKTVTAALKAANAVEAKHASPLQAESLLILGEAQFRASLNEQSVKSGQQAADLFEALKNPSGQGCAYRVIAIAQVYLGNEEESRIAAKTALAFCQQAGDQYGIGNALNAITFTVANVAEGIKLFNQARQAFESAGYLERLNAATANLGDQYLGLGLFQRARRFRLQDVQFTRQIGDRWGLTNGLTNLASLETQAGHLYAVRSVFIEFKENALALDNPNFLVNMHSLPGLLAMKEGAPQFDDVTLLAVRMLT